MALLCGENDSERGRSLERFRPGEGLVEHNPDRPQVRSDPGRSTLGTFGGKVGGRT
jgi:hypothetical protein